jgi:LacI family transcriptional regulator
MTIDATCSSSIMRVSRRSLRTQQGLATIADVARDSGFSPMTVSRVINGEKSVRETTRQAVMEAIERLNYSPNLAARTLAAAEQIRIGLLYSNPSASYLSRFLVGSLEQARLSHVQLVIEDCNANDDEEEAVRTLMASNVDGIILSPPLCDSERILAMIEKAQMLAVVVANWRPPGKISVVRIDDIEAAATMTRHLIALGHRRIGFIQGNRAHKASAQRLLGYKSALAAADIPLTPELIAQGQFTYRSGLDATELLLNLSNPPTAIFACNDDMAAAAVTVAHRRHLDVPKDLTICGFDDTDFAQSIWPELTTIHQPIADMSREAVNLLVDQIRARRAGKEDVIADRLLDFTFVQRASDAPVRT